VKVIDLRRRPDDPCACGHARQMHQHYRPGTDCGTCGAAVCPKFRKLKTARQRTGG
jgi:hypothetical protein